MKMIIIAFCDLFLLIIYVNPKKDENIFDKVESW